MPLTHHLSAFKCPYKNCKLPNPQLSLQTTSQGLKRMDHPCPILRCPSYSEVIAGTSFHSHCKFIKVCLTSLKSCLSNLCSLIKNTTLKIHGCQALQPHLWPNTVKLLVKNSARVSRHKCYFHPLTAYNNSSGEKPQDAAFAREQIHYNSFEEVWQD